MWIRFEADPAFHFDFYLAEKLGKSVVEIRQLSSEEYVAWGVYYGRKGQAREMAARKG